MLNRSRKWLEPYVPYKEVVTSGAMDNATEVVLLASRYLFTEREGRKQWAVCTHCHGGHYPEQTLKHNSVAACPHCNSACMVKASGRGRSRMIDQSYFLYFDKSPNNPDAIVARGIHVVRDYSGDYRNVETEYNVLAYYVFEPGHAAMMRNRYGEWGVCATAYTLSKYYSAFPSSYSRYSIGIAVAGTPFQYSTWEHYDIGDMTGFFTLAARYRCVEYLTKLGFDRLVTAKICKGDGCNSIYWHGKNILKVLRLTRDELNEIRRQKISVSFAYLEILKRIKKNGWDLQLRDMISLAEGFSSVYDFDSLQEILGHKLIKKIPAKKARAYLKKQYERDRERCPSLRSMAVFWRDYLEDAERNGMDLKSDHVLFPKSVYQIHQNMIRQARLKADAALNAKIAGRLEDLEKRYCFELAGLFIRPARDTFELIAEGEALNHCVGNYGDRYAEGQTVILFVRKAAEPDKPYFTVEVRPGDKEIFQVHGRHNRPPGEDVKDFLACFTAEKLQKKVKEVRIRVPA